MSKQTLVAALKSELEMTIDEINYLKSVDPDSMAFKSASARADRLRAMLTDAENSFTHEGE